MLKYLNDQARLVPIWLSPGATRSIVKDNISFESDRNLLGVSAEQQQRLLKAVLDQQWPGIPEYSEVVFEHSAMTWLQTWCYY